MFLLDPTTTERYLRDRGELDPQETVRVSELSGGVSNQVLLIERSRSDRFVLKQAREQLRVQQEWKCDVRRIWREMDVLKICGDVLREANFRCGDTTNAPVPAILFEDRENFCYAMTAAPADHKTWKVRLIAGLVEPSIAQRAGMLLGALHAGTWQNESIAGLLGDRSYFDALRIDPYYRRIAEVHSELRSEIDLLIDSVEAHRLCLVHGDFSPKNILLSADEMLLIDFEVGHYGDPAFDNGFCLTHLVLKTLWAGPRRADYLDLLRRFWESYAEVLRARLDARNWMALEERSIFNLAGCMLARIDGKSPVDYLSEDQRHNARQLATQLLRSPPELMHDVIRIIE